ncbi:MAG: FAD:protein FMN transferase [Bacteroidales bacterium]|jgi:thiamine biosynthesis lipoprotein|nr:FAD:protein FMN transferase [Bacteroidales bacterium]
MSKDNLFILAAAMIMACAGCTPDNRYYTIDGTTQGTTFHIVFQPQVSSDSSFAAVRDSVNAILERIDFSVSGYNKESVLTAFNEEGNPHVDKIFLDNFLASVRMTEESLGMFDASAAPLFDLWGFGFRTGTEVTQAMIDSVLQFVGMDHFHVDSLKAGDGSDSILIQRDDPRCRLNFNAIAQGYTSDLIAAKFSEMGMENFLVEVGGEVYARGVNPKGKFWNVGIDRPVDGNNSPGKDIQAVVHIQNQGLVTSGDYRKFYIKDGKKISHSINPKTGYPVEHNLLSATVVAPDATIADGYATYLMVLGFDKAREVVESNEKIEALLIFSDGDSLKVWMSEGMDAISTGE